MGRRGCGEAVLLERDGVKSVKFEVRSSKIRLALSPAAVVFVALELGGQLPMESNARFFYHSFPQWIHLGTKAQDAHAASLAILYSILKWGLLLTPEQVDILPEPDGDEKATEATLPIHQRRVCFTELGPAELGDHVEAFGPISLEFEQSTLISAGAMPVIYVPGAERKGQVGDGFGLIGRTLIYRLGEIYQLLSDLADIDEVVEQTPFDHEVVISGPDGSDEIALRRTDIAFLLSRFRSGRQSPRELAYTAGALAKLFYPAGTPKLATSNLEFYHEREWRIFSGPTLASGPISAPVPAEAIQEIGPIIDGATDPYEGAPLQAAKFLASCELLSTICGKPIKKAVRRILVPRNMFKQAKIVALRFSCQDRIHSY